MAWRDNADGTSEFDFKQGADCKFPGAKVVLAATPREEDSDVRVITADGRMQYRVHSRTGIHRDSMKARALENVLSWARGHGVVGQLFGGPKKWVQMNGYEAFFADTLMLKVTPTHWSMTFTSTLGDFYCSELPRELRGGNKPEAKVLALTSAHALLAPGLPQIKAMEEFMRSDLVKAPVAAAPTVDPNRMIACAKNPANHPHHPAGQRCSYC